MKSLQVTQMATLLRVQESAASRETLLEQAQPYLKRNPYLLLDLEGIHLSSIFIGEIVNLVKAFDEEWLGTSHGIALINVPETSAKVLQAVHLNRHLPCFDTATEALRHFAEHEDAPARTSPSS